MDVLHQGLGLVLREHVDGGDLRIHQVGKDEVADPIAVRERKRRLCVLGSEWVEAGALSPPREGYSGFFFTGCIFVVLLGMALVSVQPAFFHLSKGTPSDLAGHPPPPPRVAGRASKA